MIVADASPLIALARIGRLSLCQRLYETVAIPTAVNEEILRHARGFEGARPSWIDVHVVQDSAFAQSLRQVLDEGESEAVALAVQLQVPLLIDEVRGRRVAALNGVPVRGTLGLLHEAKQAGHVRSLGEEFRKLQAEGFRMSASLVADLLRAAGEDEVW